MNLEKIFRDVGKAGAKVLLNKQEETTVMVDVDKLGTADIFKSLIKRLMHEGNYNKAENLIFEELSKNYSEEVYEVAIDFYNSLLKKTDEELKNCDFSRDEINQGLEDLKLIIK